MTGWTIAVLALVAIAAVALMMWAWSSSARKVPGDETLRHPRPESAEPVVRTESRHRDTPGPADLDVKGGREHDA
jgi:cyanate permease